MAQASEKTQVEERLLELDLQMAVLDRQAAEISYKQAALRVVREELLLALFRIENDLPQREPYPFFKSEKKPTLEEMKGWFKDNKNG